MQHWRQLTFRELEQATRNFSQRNIIGEGGFGLAYKGLLQDGSIVAIKRRLRTQTRSFVHEVHLTFYKGIYWSIEQLSAETFSWLSEVKLLGIKPQTLSQTLSS